MPKTAYSCSKLEQACGLSECRKVSTAADTHMCVVRQETLHDISASLAEPEPPEPEPEEDEDEDALRTAAAAASCTAASCSKSRLPMAW